MKNIALYISILINILLICGFIFIIQRLGGFSYVKAKMRTGNMVGVYDSRINHFKKLPMPNDAIGVNYCKIQTLSIEE